MLFPCGNDKGCNIQLLDLCSVLFHCYMEMVNFVSTTNWVEPLLNTGIFIHVHTLDKDAIFFSFTNEGRLRSMLGMK